MSRISSHLLRRFVPTIVALVATFGLVLAMGGGSAAGATAAGSNGSMGSVQVHGFGGAPALGAPAGALNAPMVGMAANRKGTGYWLVGQDGGIFNYGRAKFYGSTGAMHLNQPIVGIAPTVRGHGYWLVAADGGIFTFGDAKFHGSTGAMHLNQPIVGIAPTVRGHGYWLVAADGGIFAFGDAKYHGSTGGFWFGAPIVGIAATPQGHGYWIATADGRVLSYGDAPKMHAVTSTAPIVGIESDAQGTGLWLLASDGAIFTTGTARYSGGRNHGPAQAFAIARAGSSAGYWIATGPAGPPLPPNSGSGRRIVYSNAQQRMWLVEANGIVSHTFLVSGRHGLPAVGTDHVYSKVPTSPSGNLTLPWTLRFAHAPSGAPIDIHGIPLEPNGTPIEPDSLLGTPQSHGCVRMKQSEAEFVWNWSTVGTTVVVTDIG